MAAETREVPTKDIQYGSIYLFEVYIGTRPQRLLLDFDTGSADTWVRYLISPMKIILIPARSGPPNFRQTSRRQPATPSLTPKSLRRSSLRKTRNGRSHMETTPLLLELLALIM